MKLLLLLLLVPFGTAFAQEPIVLEQEPIVLEQLTDDGSILVQLVWPEVGTDEIYDIEFSFLDPQTNEPITSIIHYQFSAMQGETIIEIWENSTNTGVSSEEVLYPENMQGPTEIYIEILSITDDSGTIENYQEVMFSVTVVPEFPIVVPSFAQPNLVVGVSYGNPLKGPSPYAIYFANYGDSVATNINLQVLAVDDYTFDITQEDEIPDTLEPTGRVDVMFTINPMTMGEAEIYYVLEWEDQEGNKYSTDDKDKPAKFNTIFLPPPEQNVVGLTQQQSIFVSVSVLIVGISVAVFMVRKSKKLKN